MDFRLTDEQKLTQETARDFVDRNSSPTSGSGRRRARSPGPSMRRWRHSDSSALRCPRSTAAPGWTTLRSCSSSKSSAEAPPPCERPFRCRRRSPRPRCYGSARRTRRTSGSCAREGTKLGAWALTEPQAGSDAGNLQTTARLDGRRVGPQRAEAVHLERQHRRPSCRYTPGNRGTKGHDGISLFMVPSKTDGFKVTHVETKTKLGLRASPTRTSPSRTADPEGEPHRETRGTDGRRR